MTTRLDVYAAGLVDGEGCITAKLTKNQTAMGIRVLVGMATRPARPTLEKMHSTYGGTLIAQQPDNPKHSEITTWTVTGSEAGAFLRRIEPHLMVKQEQARLALRIEEIRTSQERIGERDHYRWTADAVERCLVIYRRLMELNSRGNSPEPKPGYFARLVAGQWLTSQAALFTDLGWESYTETWPRSGYMSDGAVFELPTPEHPTGGSDCSSSPILPTPQAADGMGGHATRSGSRSGEKLLPGIARELALLPTPVSQPSGNPPAVHLRKKPGRTQVTDLAIIVENGLLPTGGALLPTPRARDHKGCDPNPRGVDLNEAVRLLPTPRASDGEEGGPGQRGSKGDLTLPSAAAQIGDRMPQPSTAGNNA